MATLSVSGFDQLTPEDGILYFFAVGPGSGEALGILMPGGKWLLIDSCQRKQKQAGLELISRFGGTLMAVALTHPHRDHVAGMAELLEAHQPEQVILTLPDDSLANLVKTNPRDHGYFDHLGSEAAKSAYQALANVCGKAGTKLELARSGASLDCHPLQLKFHWPDETVIAEAFQRRVIEDENLLSLVVEALWGEARLLLGADLPGAVWPSLVATAPSLTEHHLFKTPHHGSRSDLVDDICVSRPQSYREWVLTPYNSHALPRKEGLEYLLHRQSYVLLTGLPAAQSNQQDFPPPGQLHLKDFESLRAAIGDPFLADAVELRPIQDFDILDTVWAVGFDKKGSVVGRWRGRGAVEVWADP